MLSLSLLFQFCLSKRELITVQLVKGDNIFCFSKGELIAVTQCLDGG